MKYLHHKTMQKNMPDKTEIVIKANDLGRKIVTNPQELLSDPRMISPLEIFVLLEVIKNPLFKWSVSVVLSHWWIKFIFCLIYKEICN